jgi:O-antigen/teichoic acid export membrane protein
VQLAGSWWLVRAGAGVVPLVILALGVQLAQIGSAVMLWRPVFGAGGNWRRPSRRELIAMLRRALPFAASGIVANFQTRIGPLMLGYLATPSELGLFAAASRFGRVARLVPQAIFAGALPVLSHEYGRDRDAAQRAFRTFDRALLLLTLPSAAACALLAAPLIGLVYGASFAKAAPALVWVGIGLIPALSNSAKKVLLYAAGGEGLVVRWSAAGLVVQAVSAAMLIPAMGASGAALSIAIGEAVIWVPLRRAQLGFRLQSSDFRLVEAPISS